MNLFLLYIWAILMSSSFIVSANMAQYASPIATSGFRFALALIFISFILVIKWKMDKLNIASEIKNLFTSPKLIINYIIISGTLVGFFIGLFIALQYTTALNTSVVYTLVPLISIVFSRIFLKEILMPIKVVGFILGSISAIILLLSSQSSSILFANISFNKGDIIFTLACMFLALHVIFAQKWGKVLPPISSAFMIMCFGVLWLLPITIIWGNLNQVTWHAGGFWLNALYLTIFTTLLTFILQQRLVQHVGANRLLAFSYTIPLWVAIYSAMSNHQLQSILNSKFLAGVFILVIAFILIESKKTNVVY
ncbi:DMT family transporter [Marinicellulosiphila megalodicopiae]|uniref:DMT family transporter n=1 Tax=Marinicellulosiphila megalodicopiae TaxID=2724896 RepID=UPI003BB1E7B7